MEAYQVAQSKSNSQEFSAMRSGVDRLGVSPPSSAWELDQDLAVIIVLADRPFWILQEGVSGLAQGLSGNIEGLKAVTRCLDG